jgi:hypothetical protein
VPGAELIAEETELRPLVEDAAFFAANDFRMTRFRMVVPECRMAGLAWGDLLQGNSYRASSIDFTQPSFEALVNCDKPVKPFLTSPLMVHEALGLLREPLRVDHLRITNGRLTYSERMFLDSAPAVLTFGAVDFSVEGIANRGDATAAIQIQAQGELMDAGTLKVRMSIPITPPDFSFHYSGSLGAMDLTRLNAFIDLTQHIRIKSGTAEAAAFDIQVVAGVARGRFQGGYRDLQVAVLDKETGSESGLDNRVTSFLANVLKVRTANRAEGAGAMKEGQVNHARQPADAFLEFVWAALWSGVRDAITH